MKLIPVENQDGTGNPLQAFLCPIVFITINLTTQLHL